MALFSCSVSQIQVHRDFQASFIFLHFFLFRIHMRFVSCSCEQRNKHHINEYIYSARRAKHQPAFSLIVRLLFFALRQRVCAYVCVCSLGVTTYHAAELDVPFDQHTLSHTHTHTMRAFNIVNEMHASSYPTYCGWWRDRIKFSYSMKQKLLKFYSIFSLRIDSRKKSRLRSKVISSNNSNTFPSIR